MEEENRIIIEKVKKLLTCANEIIGKHYIKNLISLPCGFKACSECFQQEGVLLNCEYCKENHDLDRNEDDNYDYLFENYGLLILSDLIRVIETFVNSRRYLLIKKNSF
jgi:hypothetical protein